MQLKRLTLFFFAALLPFMAYAEEENALGSEGWYQTCFRSQ